MRDESIELRGTYRYPDSLTLERALTAAREQLDEDDHSDLDDAWLGACVRQGSVLRVHARLGHGGDRFLAAAVLETLAREAVEGVVEARRGGVAVDFFPYGQDPD
jgi:hypothetical protein